MIVSLPSAFKRAVEADPKFTRAWIELAIVHMATGQSDSALDALRKAIDSDPKRDSGSQDLRIRAYGFAPRGCGRAKLKCEDRPADDPEASSGWAGYSCSKNATQRSLAVLGNRRELRPIPRPLETALGAAYLRAGQIEKGTVTLKNAVEADPGPEMWNDVGYELADANISLPKALEYAQHAVDAQEMESHDIELDNLLPEDLACTWKIGMFWDTLGWVHFRLGHLDQAESYLHAAWLLSQGSVEADHLGQVYEQQKKTEKAIHMYRLALATPEANAPGGSWDETRHRLEHLTGTKAPTAMDLLRGDPNGSELSQLRTIKLKRIVPGSATAEFFLLFSPGPKVESVEFISGSEKLKSTDECPIDGELPGCFPGGQFRPPGAARDCDVFGCLGMRCGAVYSGIRQIGEVIVACPPPSFAVS